MREKDLHLPRTIRYEVQGKKKTFGLKGNVRKYIAYGCVMWSQQQERVRKKISV